ncbi:hypothetical protein BSKO_02077 [Bryopsis sp. KO-2023]|nr:hypothetical protein BSKO_02077 [Bryopsis sp. KO-2023]
MVNRGIFRAPVVWEEHEHGQNHERARQAQGPEPATQSKGATLLVCAFEKRGQESCLLGVPATRKPEPL